jgi:predicted acetyltransferase
MMITYRSLNEHDRDQAARLDGYAFGNSPEPARFDPLIISRMRGLWDDAALVAQLRLIDIQVQSGANTLPAVGIASVAGAPETRRKGHVALLLHHAMAETAAAGTALAVLYPFKRTFYGRYGWANYVERRVYSGPPERLAGFRLGPGRFVHAGPGQTDALVAELDGIYRGALRGRFGPLVRDDVWWRERVLRDYYNPATPPAYVAIWRDDAGNGRSYLIYDLAKTSAGRRLDCWEIVATDPTARAQLFAFMAGHQDQVAEVRFRAPVDAPVNMLLPDPLECAVEPHFMLRILDVPAALEQYAFPPDLAGSFTLAVHDDWMPANNAAFNVELANGAAQVTRLPAGAPAGLSLDIRVLAQIYSRAVRPRSAAAFGMITVADRSHLGVAERAFTGLPPFVSDFF